MNGATYHQTLAMIPICLAEISMGSVFGWVAPMVRVFLEDPNSEVLATEEECSWMASLTEFGRTFGPMCSLLLLDVLGRKMVLQIASTIFFIIWIAILFTRSVIIICATLFIFGLGFGISNASSAVYIGENSSPNLRGIFCSISTTCFYLGMLFQYVIAGYLSYHTIGVVNLITNFGCLVGTLLLVESSQFLMLKERFRKAEKNMMWLNGTNKKEDIACEFEIIKSNVASEKLKKSSYKELFTSTANYKSLMIVLILNMAHAATGNGALFTYISILFPPNEFVSWYQITVYFGISQLLFCFIASLIIEKFSRRALALFSFVMFIICHCTAAYFLYDAANNASPIKYGVWIIFVSVCMFSGVSAILDSVIHMLRGELFPQSIKPIGTGLAITLHSFMEFLTIKIFLRIKSSYGTYTNFVGYAVVSLFLLFFTYFILPETRGKTLVEIQKSLEKQKLKDTKDDREEEM